MVKNLILGIFVLLDTLETASNRVRRHTFGCILDVLENIGSIPYMLQWRTKNDIEKGIVQLLLKIWKEQEVFLEVTTGLGGVVIPGLMPLRGAQQMPVFL